VHVIFQPHRFTRTRDLLDQFGAAFTDADTVLVLDIYAASEAPIPGVTGERVAQSIQSIGRQAARYVSSFDEAARHVAALAGPGDMVLTLGAGSVSQLGPMVLERLKLKQAAVSAPQSA